MEVTKPIFQVCGTPTYVAPEILVEGGGNGYGLEEGDISFWLFDGSRQIIAHFNFAYNQKIITNNRLTIGRLVWSRISCCVASRRSDLQTEIKTNFST